MQVGILQFSNDVRVELEPQVVDREVFDKKLATMVRFQGWFIALMQNLALLAAGRPSRRPRRVQCW